MPNVTITGTTVATSVPVYTFGGSNVTLFNLGSIESTGNSAVLSTLASNTVVNSGTIGSGNTQRIGIRMSAGGAVTNQAGATIAGGARGAFLTSGVVDNAGRITGGGTGVASGVTGALAVTNQSTGTISGTQFGIAISGGGSVVNKAGGTIAGSYAVVGTIDTVDNAGLIAAQSFAVRLLGTGSVTNRATGTITGTSRGVLMNVAGTVDNALNPSSPTLIDPTIFVANATGSFTSGDQRLAYNTTSGSLFYSATGNNAGALMLAALTGAPTLTASDIYFER